MHVILNVLLLHTNFSACCSLSSRTCLRSSPFSIISFLISSSVFFLSDVSRSSRSSICLIYVRATSRSFAKVPCLRACCCSNLCASSLKGMSENCYIVYGVHTFGCFGRRSELGVDVWFPYCTFLIFEGVVVHT